MKANINRTVHLLTNRISFPDNYFVTGTDIYDPYIENNIIVQLKDILQLNNEDTNYYLLCILSCIDNYDYLRKRINDSVTSYNISDIVPEPTTFELATPIPNIDGAFGFNHKNTTYPITFTYEIEYVNNTHLSINKTEIVQYGLGDKKLYPQWQNNFIYTGGLNLVADWTSGSYVRINYKPKYYPADKVVELLDNTYTKEQLLLKHRLLEAYITSKDNYEKIAIIATVIILENPNK